MGWISWPSFSSFSIPNPWHKKAPMPEPNRDPNDDTIEDMIRKMMKKKNSFKEDFLRCLCYLDLNESDKVFVSLRYVRMVEDIETRQKKTLRSYNTHRLIILFSGIMVPVLITIKDNIPNPATVFWLTLLVSVSGSISNAWMEYFNVVKMHFTYIATLSALKREGWNFITLSGRYLKYRRHYQCVARFSNSIEKIQMKGINMYMLNTAHVRDTGGMNGKMTMEEAGIFDLIKNYPLSLDTQSVFRPNERRRRPPTGPTTNSNVMESDFHHENIASNFHGAGGWAPNYTQTSYSNMEDVRKESATRIQRSREEEDDDDLAFPEDSEESSEGKQGTASHSSQAPRMQLEMSDLPTQETSSSEEDDLVSSDSEEDSEDK